MSQMKILIVAKQSKYEWEKQKFGLSHDELTTKYSSERANLDAILLSHEKQIQVRERIKDIIPSATICTMEKSPEYLTDEMVKEREWDMIIVVGGDNSFTFVSHWAADIPVLGVNSDPVRSVGALTRWAIHDDQSIYDLVEIIDFHEYDIHSWSKLGATIDGRIITSASNEYFFGERQSCKMSRHVLVYKGQEYEQKSSGIIISTGAGSTGWYSSVRGKQAVFDPTWDIGAFVVREPYDPDGSGCYAGEIDSNDEIILYSLNDDEGIVSIDSWGEFPFLRGSEARIYMGCPLNVVIPRDANG